MEKLGQEYRCRTSPVQCHVPISFRDRRMNRLNTTLLTSAPLVAQIHSHRQPISIGANCVSPAIFFCARRHRRPIQFSPSTSPGLPPVPLSHLAAPDLALSSASRLVHSAAKTCYASSRSISFFM